MDDGVIRAALSLTGALLDGGEAKGGVVIWIGGGAAGLLGGELAGYRTTSDCDVFLARPEEVWSVIAEAARHAANELGISETWLSRDATKFAHGLALEWQSRSELVGRFGPLEVRRLSRIDLIAAKVVSSPKRPQDREDLVHMKPTELELDFASDNLDRMEAESLDPDETFEDQRRVLDALRTRD